MSSRKQRTILRMEVTLSSRLRYLRFWARLTQQEVADKLELSRSSISSFETAAAVPSLFTAYRICRFFGVSVDFLFSTEQEEGVTKDSALERFLSAPKVRRLKRRR